MVFNFCGFLLHFTKKVKSIFLSIFLSICWSVCHTLKHIFKAMMRYLGQNRHVLFLWLWSFLFSHIQFINNRTKNIATLLLASCLIRTPFLLELLYWKVHQSTCILHLNVFFNWKEPEKPWLHLSLKENTNQLWMTYKR